MTNQTDGMSYPQLEMQMEWERPTPVSLSLSLSLSSTALTLLIFEKELPMSLRSSNAVARVPNEVMWIRSQLPIEFARHRYQTCGVRVVRVCRKTHPRQVSPKT